MISTLGYSRQCLDTFSFNGSSKFGNESNTWIDNKTKVICNAEDYICLIISKHILPKKSILGWYILV